MDHSIHTDDEVLALGACYELINLTKYLGRAHEGDVAPCGVGEGD